MDIALEEDRERIEVASSCEVGFAIAAVVAYGNSVEGGTRAVGLRSCCRPFVVVVVAAADWKPGSECWRHAMANWTRMAWVMMEPEWSPAVGHWMENSAWLFDWEERPCPDLDEAMHERTILTDGLLCC